VVEDRGAVDAESASQRVDRCALAMGPDEVVGVVVGQSALDRV